MANIDLTWEEGDVGNWLMRVGLVSKVAHVYKNPWSPVWVAELKANEWVGTFTSAEEAKLVVELEFRNYLDDLLHVEDDGLIFFGNTNMTFEL